MSDRPRTTYARAAAGYDLQFEQKLTEQITAAIVAASLVTDANVIILRTRETASALVTALATFLAMSPAATRSPTAMRKITDELGKRLRRRVALAAADPGLQEFMRRTFNGTDDGGHA
jgi:hypothetical protein